MALTSLVVCADLKAVQVLSQILRELNIAAEHCGDLASAATRLRSSISTRWWLIARTSCPPYRIDCSVRKRRSIAALSSWTGGRTGTGPRHLSVTARTSLCTSRFPWSGRQAACGRRGSDGTESAANFGSRCTHRRSITYANAENVAATLLDLSEDGLAISPSAGCLRCRSTFNSICREKNLPSVCPAMWCGRILPDAWASASWTCRKLRGAP